MNGEFDGDLWRDRVRSHLHESAGLKRRVAQDCVSSVLAAAGLVVETFRNGGKALLCGNGGSAADCQHMAAEFVSRLTKGFERPGLPAIALTTDTSFLTAFANDCEFGGIFERQVRVLGKSGDVLIAISTSGNSANVLRAVSAARELGVKTVGLMGEGGALDAQVDCAIAVPSRNTQYIQETFLSVEHILCDLAEQMLFGQGG
jgi:phosphoheptose isomerase